MPSEEMTRLTANLGLATIMVAITVLIHFWGLLGLTRVLNGGGRRLKPHKGTLRAAFAVLVVVFGIFALHSTEIWMYAAVYRALGELTTFEEALYFSTVSFSSVGFGDIVLSPRWRLMSAIEGANGFILFGWSTAFFMTVTSRLRLIEHDWLEHKS